MEGGGNQRRWAGSGESEQGRGKGGKVGNDMGGRGVWGSEAGGTGAGR